VTRAVFFDASDVLYSRPVSTARFAVELVVRHGYRRALEPADEDRVRTAHDEAMVGLIDAAAYWEVFLTAHGVASPAERAALRATILEHTHEVTPTPGARITLAALKRRGFLLGIITDTLYPLEWKLRWLADVADLLDQVTSSAVVGSRKPAPAIYLHALNQAGTTASEAVFIGHDAREIAGAKSVGMVTVAIGNEPGVAADYRIGALADLLTIPPLRSGSSC
jgi:HAD superfamily hydrolase (TIGR01509 family)